MRVVTVSDIFTGGTYLVLSGEISANSNKRITFQQLEHRYLVENLLKH